MNAKKVFSADLVSTVVEGLNAMGINATCTDKNLLDCAIDEIRKIKEGAKEALKAQDAAAKKVADAEAFANGEKLLANAKVGDIATVVCGSGKFAKEYNSCIYTRFSYRDRRRCILLWFLLDKRW